ncbi:MAG: RNA polymerase sigma factor [Bryobacteraceae bacterium]|nr:RNA polymerase sigma factor [Bryobacteraceae bacterium]
MSTERRMDREDTRALEEFLDCPSLDTFPPLFLVLHPRVHRFFAVRGCQADSDELAQDVLLSVYHHGAEVRDRRLFYGWIFQVARNRFLQYLREKKRPEGFEFTAIGEAALAAAQGADPLQDYSFARLIANVDPLARQILTLRFVDELDYDEIAFALGIPAGTVKWKVFDAKQRLRAFLTKGKR